MIKEVSTLAGLFILSGLLSVMFIPLAPIIVGVAMSAIAAWKFKSRQSTDSKLGSNLLFRSGLAVVAGAVITTAFVIAAMTGLFK